MSDLRVTNLRGRTPGSSPILPDGVEIAGIVTAKAGAAVTYYGDGSNLTGIDASALKDSDNTIRVQANTSGVVVTGVLTATSFSGIDASSLSDSDSTTRVQATTSGAVVTGVLTATSFSGDGSALTFAPKIIAFDPVALSTGISTTTNITITFDQDIKTAGTGDILIKSGSSTGTTLETLSITNGTPATGISTAGTQLIINPQSDLPHDTNIFVILPNNGIQSTNDVPYNGSDTYNFRTNLTEFTAIGGDANFDVNTGTGPTGWHRYHIFTSTGILTATSPSTTAQDLSYILVGGGGGGSLGGGGAGGVVSGSGPGLSLNAGTYTITIGSGGAYQNPLGTNAANGQDSTISTSSNNIHKIAYGGGGGGGNVSGISTLIVGLDGGSGGGGNAAPDTFAGDGVSGQGNPGGLGADNAQYNWSRPGGGGGGSGAPGGTGSNVEPGSPVFASQSSGGAGGDGAPHVAFASTILSPNMSVIPVPSLIEIGPAGRFGGGGGGGAPTYNDHYISTPQPQGGAGGGGGGGSADFDAEDGFASTGGGGGGGSEGPSNTPGPSDAKSGGSGVFMIRYEIPAP